MRPIDDMLKAAQGKTRFHMPGHKGRLEAVPAALDMTELPSTDDLYAPQAGIAEAERLLARSAGAGASILVPCGSTAGILAMVLAFVRPGGRLLMRRGVCRACYLHYRAQRRMPHIRRAPCAPLRESYSPERSCRGLLDIGDRRKFSILSEPSELDRSRRTVSVLCNDNISHIQLRLHRTALGFLTVLVVFGTV